jgi:hypothetical protein
MALVVADRVQETATANTTVSFTLAGAVASFQSFAVVGDTNTTYYSATDASGNWEVGLGTYSTTGPTLTRTTILSSSNSNAAVTFSGTVNVFVTYPASKAIFSPTGTLAKSTTVYTSGAGTYTAPANTQWVKITVVGPGAAGGSGVSRRGGGGGAGGVAIKWVAMTAGQTLLYQLGTPQLFDSTVSAGTLSIATITGGFALPGSSNPYAASVTTGGVGGAASGGDINITGGQGGASYGASTSITTNMSGGGGNCPGFGSGGSVVGGAISAGLDPTGYGAGGGGALGSVTAGIAGLPIIIFEAY